MQGLNNTFISPGTAPSLDITGTDLEFTPSHSTPTTSVNNSTAAAKTSEDQTDPSTASAGKVTKDGDNLE
jgi:hypothetical protein